MMDNTEVTTWTGYFRRANMGAVKSFTNRLRAAEPGTPQHENLTKVAIRALEFLDVEKHWLTANELADLMEIVFIYDDFSCFLETSSKVQDENSSEKSSPEGSLGANLELSDEQEDLPQNGKIEFWDEKPPSLWQLIKDCFSKSAKK